MTSYFISQVDSLDVSDSFVVVGLSNLDGNIWDGGIKLLSVENGSELHSKHCECGMSMVRFAGQNKNFVLTARDDGNVALYSSATLDDLLLLSAHDDIVSCVAVSELTETEFVSCGWDGCIKIWDWQSENKDTPVLSIDAAHYQHVNEVSVSALDSSLLASVGQDGFLRIWDKRTNVNKDGCVQIFNLQHAGSCVEWDAHQAHYIYAGTDAGTVSIFDLRSDGATSESTSSSSVGLVGMQHIHQNRVRRLRCVRDREGILVSCADDATIAVSNVSAATSNDGHSKAQFEEKSRFSIHKDYVADLAVMESGTKEEGGLTILSASSDKTVKITKYPATAN
jgi:WD40 repeat protein